MTSECTEVLVVGGGGFIGTHVCAALRRAGRSTMATGRRTVVAESDDRRRGENLGPFIEAELDDVGTMGRLLERVETVICLASSSLPASSNGDIGAEVHQHVESTVRLAQLAAESGVARFVFASSGGTVYGRSSSVGVDESSSTEPMSAYGVSKLAIENYLRVIGHLTSMRTLSLRVANPYGPGQRINRRHGFISTAIECAVNDLPLTIWGDGTTQRDFVFVEDVATAFVAATEYDGTCPVINVGSGQATSLLEAVACVQEVLSVELDIRFEAGRAVDVPVNSLSIERARTELLWQPSVDLTAGIHRTAAARLANRAPDGATAGR